MDSRIGELFEAPGTPRAEKELWASFLARTAASLDNEQSSSPLLLDTVYFKPFGKFTLGHGLPTALLTSTSAVQGASVASACSASAAGNNLA